MPGYAVFDVETTGLSPRSHRVAEIAVVHVDPQGRLTEEWSTLFNPGRDLGPTDRHRIRAADVRKAPTFGTAAGELVKLFVGRVPVAHNLPFDTRFLTAEFARLGVDVPLDPTYGLCTMRLSTTYLSSAASRGLGNCCAAAGIRPGSAHEALEDARAAARLLSYYLRSAPSPPPWNDLLHRCSALAWPEFPETAFQKAVRSRPGHEEKHFLFRLVEKMPADWSVPELAPYFAVLDRALIDRHLSASEADELVETAGYLGLSRGAARGAHRWYLRALAATAWADGIVTNAEHDDLQRVTTLLGLSGEDLAAALREAELAPQPGRDGHEDVPVPASFALSVDDHVVFTGTSERSREEWNALAAAAGLTPKSAVSKRTRVVVAADPDSLSGKARKAREYGIPIVTEEAFEEMLGTMG